MIKFPADDTGTLIKYPKMMTMNKKIHRIVECWQIAKQPKLLPAKEDLKLEKVAELLANCWLLSIEDKPSRLKIDLVGSNLIAIYGQDNKGKYLDQLYPKQVYDNIRIFMNKIIGSGEPYFSRDSNHNPKIKFDFAERVYLPLGENRRVDYILGYGVFYNADLGEIY
jgi:hypothetical protein